MVTFDTDFLTMMFFPTAKHSLSDAAQRINFLISDLNGSGDQIVVPTPALSEVLIKSGAARDKIVQELTKTPKFIVAPFDTLAAIELSLMSDAAFTRSDKKDGATGTWAKVKFDRQIVAISKVMRVSRIYSDDDDIHAIGKREGLRVLRVSDIAMPSTTAPMFDLRPPNAQAGLK